MTKLPDGAYMKILCDMALPNSLEVFSQYGEVKIKNGREICADDLVGVDALITRSITRVNSKLLSKATNLKFVGTATAGMDHFDTNLLDMMHIPYTNAQGANCQSVADYVLSVLLVLAQRYGLQLEKMSIGIVGCGFVGSQVELRAQALGMKIVKCDPPRHRDGDVSCDGTLEDALACDVVSLHVPLTEDGPDKTKYMLGRNELSSLKLGAILINAARGKVIDNQALCDVLKERLDLKVWLDVFEGEPEIKVKGLLNEVEGATAHIAGYSFESKRRANVMLAKSMASMLNLEDPKDYIMPAPEIYSIDLGNVQVLDLDLISRLVFSVYDVRRDSHHFANTFCDGKSFDMIRGTYRERRELSSLHLKHVNKKFAEKLSLLGFTVD
ncbi:MAG: 4-phosphoerythronate dehydrogenase [Succinivibrio sp.]